MSLSFLLFDSQNVAIATHVIHKEHKISMPKFISKYPEIVSFVFTGYKSWKHKVLFCMFFFIEIDTFNNKKCTLNWVIVMFSMEKVCILP